MPFDIRFFPEYCLRTIHRAATCKECYDICPTHAIDFKAKSVQLDTLKCLNCAACVSVCPTDVFEAKSPLDEEILALIEREKQKKTKREIIFTCQRIKTQDCDAIRLPCLARLDTSFLLACLTHTITSIKLIHGICEKCYSSNIEKRLRHRITYIQNTMNAFGMIDMAIKSFSVREDSIQKEEKINGITQKGQIRRRMLLTLLGQTKTQKKDDGVLSAQYSVTFQDNMYQNGSLPKQRRFIFCLEALSKEFSLTDQAYTVGLKPSIDASLCQECSICTRICPTGALRIENQETFHIAYSPKRCIECHLCADVCFAKAISWSPKPLKDLFQDLPLTLLKRQQREKESECNVVIYRT